MAEETEVPDGQDIAPDPGTEPEVEPKVEAKAEPYYAPQVPAGSYERMKEIDEQLAALDQKVDDADIDEKEYREQTRKLYLERGEIAGAIAYAKNRLEDDRRAAELRFWADDSNKPWAENKGLFEALSAAVQQLRADPSAVARGQDWIIQEAKRQTVVSFSKALGIDPSSVGGGKNGKGRKAQETKEDIPISLRDFPGGKSGATDEFSVVSSMDTPNQLNAMRDWSREKIQAWMDRYI